jgi:Family of unknown function (DUF6585)
MGSPPSPTPVSVLGLQTGQYRLRRILRLVYPALALFNLLATLALWGLAAWRWFFAYSTYGPALVWRVTFPLVIISVITLAVGLIGVFAYIRLGSLVVTTFEKGMTVRHGRHGKLIRWGHVRHLRTAAVRYGFAGMSWGRRASITLTLDSGEKFRFTTALGDIGNLIATIKSNVYPRLLDEYTQEFNQGHPLSFGPLTLSPEGIQQGRGRLEWVNLGRASLENGRLVLTPRPGTEGSRIRIEARRIPNVDLCLQFIQHLSKPM